ncbi:unnamed protein product [Orchesella dallaii]|uniref:Uncharacterized protein n=1 Tax=Orchesella dallaii TaxID=48710 RepID=A0ABP1RZU9_9HEXA
MVKGTPKDFEFFFLYSFAICAVIDTVSAYACFRRPHQYAAVLNNFLQIMENICRDFMPTFDREKDRNNRLMDWFLISLTIAYPINGFVISCHYILFPDWSAYAISMVPPEYRILPLKIMFGFWYFYALQVIWSILLNSVVYLFTTGRYTWLLLHEFMCRPGGDPNQKTTGAFRDISNIQVNYRKLEMMHLKIIEGPSATILPLEFVILHLALFANFSLISYGRIMTPINTAILLIWTVVGTGFVLIALDYCGTLFKKGVKVLGSMKKYNWGSKQNNMVMKKFVRSCRPIQIGYGRMYVIRKVSVFKFLRDLTKDEFMPNFDAEKFPPNKLHDLSGFLTGFYHPFAATVITCHYIIFPDWPSYITSLIPSESLTLPIKIAFGIFWFCELQMIWAILLINFVGMTTIGKYLGIILDEFFCQPRVRGVTINYLTTPKFRDMDTIRMNLRKLQVFHLNLMELFSLTIVPAQSLILNLTLFSNFSLIRYWKQMNVTNIAILLLWAIGGTFACLLMITSCAYLTDKSNMILRSARSKDWGSRKNNKVMGKFLKSCQPLRFGHGKMYVIKQKSVLKFLKTLVRGTFRVLLTIESYAVTQTILHMINGQATNFQFFFLYAITICCAISLVSSYPALSRPEEYAAIFNNFHQYMADVKEEYMPDFNAEKYKVNKLFSGILMALTIYCPICGFIISCHYIPFYDWPVYLISNVPQEYRSFPLIIVFGIDYFYALQMTWSLLLINAVCLLTTGLYNWLLLNEFVCRNGEVQGQKTVSRFRDISEIQVNYRKFELMNLKLLKLYCGIIIPLEGVILNLALFSNFSLIMYKHLLTPINAAILVLWTVAGTGFVLVGLTYCGALYLKGVKVLGSMKKKDWGSARNNKLMKKFVKSCIPIQIGYGRMYVIRKVSVFKFLRSLTKGTVRVLLMCKKHT